MIKWCWTDISLINQTSTKSDIFLTWPGWNAKYFYTKYKFKKVILAKK